MKPKVELAAPLFTMVDMSAPKVCLCLCLCRLLCECSAPLHAFRMQQEQERTAQARGMADAAYHHCPLLEPLLMGYTVCVAFVQQTEPAPVSPTSTPTVSAPAPSTSRRCQGPRVRSAQCSVLSALRRCRPALTVHTMPIPPLCRAVLQLLRMRGGVR